MKRKNKILKPESWGLNINSGDQLEMNGTTLHSLAEQYGTPLYVVNYDRLINNAIDVKKNFEKAFRGKTSVYYPLKCNSVPGIVDVIKSAGLNAEVMSEFELELALNLGYPGSQIIVNGPCKSKSFLKHCLEKKVRLLIVDSLDELKLITGLIQNYNLPADILLRINMNFIPRGVNRGSAASSIKNSVFGLNLYSDEITRAFEIIKQNPKLHFSGYHFHIGTNIKDTTAHAHAVRKLFNLFSYTTEQGYKIQVLDVGGGYSPSTTFELSSKDLLLSQLINKYEYKNHSHNNNEVKDYAEKISEVINEYFGEENLPELIVEPGRCITSDCQFLLLKVHSVKERKGTRTWLITDAGLGTLTMPTYYEYHEIFPVEKISRKYNKKYTLCGPCCFAADLIYKNKTLPIIDPGEVLALMDTGAYFNQLESSFGFPKPAIAMVKNGFHFLIRQRETFHEMINRDIPYSYITEEELK